MRRGGGGGVPKIWLKWGPCRQKNIGCKGGITKIILSSFAVTANNLPVQNDTKTTSSSDVQPEVNIFYFLREAWTLGSRGYFFLIDTDGSRRRRVNEEKNIPWNPGLEACPRSPYFIMRKKIAILPHPTNRKIIA